MKAITLAAILLVVGCCVVSEAKLNCPCYGLKRSGRMLVFLSHLFVDMPFHLDLKLQRFQSDMKIYTKHSRYPLRVSVLIDFKTSKKYVIFRYKCLTLDSNEQMPSASDLKKLILVAKGRLGMVGAPVGVYVFKKGLASGIVTLEDNDMCTPQGFTGKIKNIGLTVSYLNIKSTVNPWKLRIPRICLRRPYGDTSEDEIKPPPSVPIPPVM